jgi:beta-mannanase
MLTRKMRVAQEMGRTFMVTAEPNTKAVNWLDGGRRLFTDILAGKFDRQIADVCGAVAAFPGKQWIRRGHEMEDPSDRYPWARNDPAGYVAAYRYFVETCGKIAREARFIWSPKGEKQLAAYYPGDAHVDMVGVAVWGLERLDHTSRTPPQLCRDLCGEIPARRKIRQAGDHRGTRDRRRK